MTEEAASTPAPAETITSAAVPEATPAPAVTGPEIASTPAAVEPAAAPAVEPAKAEPEKPAEPEAPKNLFAEYDEKKAKPEEKPAEKETEPEKKADEKSSETPKEETGEKKPDASEKPKEKEAEKAAAEPEKAKDEPEAAKPEPFSFKDFEMPEGVQKDDGAVSRFKEILAKDDDPQMRGQELVNLYGDLAKAQAKEAAKQQVVAWNKTLGGWKEAWMSDEEIGGARFDTAMGAIARMRDLAVPEKDRAGFDHMLATTGVGYHPAFGRMMHNFARFFDEPAVMPVTPKPPPYSGKPGRRASVLYET